MSSRRNLCILIILIAACACDLALAMPSVRVKRQDEQQQTDVEETKTNDLNPIESQEGDLSDVDRNKRKVPDAAFEAKNAVLGFVFGVRSARATKDDDDTPEFDRNMVSLDIPDELFAQSFSTLTNVSKVASRFIMNSARRFARFKLFFKPIFGNALTVEGYNEPTSTAAP